MSTSGENNSYPELNNTNNPTLSFTVSQDQSSVTYTCQIIRSTEAGAIHNILWYFGTTLHIEVTLSGTANVDTLNSGTLINSQKNAALSDGVSVYKLRIGGVEKE